MGLLDGLFGPKGSEERLRMKMGLMGLTHQPNTALMQQWSNDLGVMRDERKAQETTNRTAQYLRGLGTAQAMQAADALEAGMVDPSTAYQMATKPAPDQREFLRELNGDLVYVNPDLTTRTIYDGGTAPDPQSAIAKLAYDLRMGNITQEQYDMAVADMMQGSGFSVTTADGTVVQYGNVGGAKPPTEGQLAGAGYLQRMTAAEQILRSVERLDGVAAIPLEKTLAVDSGVEGYVLNPTEQRIIQAQRDWVRAKLRKESGAVIAPEEMAAEIKTYFPQPGEGPEVIRQKAAARRNAERQLEIGAGSAAAQAGAISPEYTPPIRMQDLSGAGIGGADASTILDEARQAIERGADPEAVKERLRQMGVDPGSL